MADDNTKDPDAVDTAPDTAVAPVPPGAEITEVHYAGKKVTLKYAMDTPEGPDVISRVSSGDPHPDFKAALNDLAPLILNLCEIPARVGSKVEARGVKFKRSKDGAEGAVLEGFRHYGESLGGLVLNTPLRFTEDDLPKRVFDKGQWPKILRVRVEAEAYVNGKRAQGDLFAPPVSGDGQDGPPPDLSTPDASTPPAASAAPEKPKRTRAPRPKASDAASA